MGAGAAALPMMISIGSKLFGGGGGAQAAGGAPAPGPFDALTNVAAQKAPPPPGGKGAGDMANIIKNPLFSGGIDDGAAPAGDSATQRPMLPSDSIAPGATVLKSQSDIFSGGLPPQGGQKLESIQATDVTGQPRPTPKAQPAAAIKSPAATGLFGGDVEEDPAPDAAMQATTTQARPAPAMADATPSKVVESAIAGDDQSGGEGDDGPHGLFGFSFGPEIGGHLGDLQDKLGDSPTNPLFQASMGLLSSGHDGSNPYTQINKNLGAIPGLQIAAQGAGLAANADARASTKAATDAEEAQQQKLLAALLAQIGGKYGAPENAGTSHIARGAAKVVR